MASSNPPVKNVAYTSRFSLRDFAIPGSFKANPTLAAGDAKVDIDGAGFNNLGTPPSVSPAGGVGVLLSLSTSEMNGDVITITLIDQTSPKEWSDLTLVINTTTYAQTVPQTGDSYARIGAGGVSLNAIPDEAGVTTLLTRLTSTRAGYLDNLSAGAVALQSSLSSLITTVGAAGAGLTAIATQVWAAGTRVLTAGTNIVLAKGTGITGFNDLDAAGVRSAVGLASANLDTQLAAIPAAPSAATVAAAVWEEDMAGHTTDGTAGGDQNIIPHLPDAVWNVASENGEGFGAQVRLIRASAVGESHDGAEHPVYMSADGNTERITADVDITSGNRSNVITNPD